MLAGARMHAFGSVFKLVGHVGEQPFTALLDSGGSGPGFIGTAFAARCGLKLSPSENTIQLADGTVVPAAGQVSVSYTLAATTGAPLSFTSTFTATPLENYDIILGVGWLTEHDVLVGWRQRSLEVRTPGRASRHIRPVEVIAGPDAAQPGQLATITAKALRKDLRRGRLEEIYAVILGKPEQPASDPAGGDPDMLKLIEEFRDVFPEKLPAELPPQRGVEHGIELQPNARPPPVRPLRQQSAKDSAVINEFLQKGLASGQLRPSHSPYGSMLVIVKKKDGTPRVCVDYRALNDITIKNKYPLPLMDELFDRVQGSMFFSTLDLMDGFYQIRLAAVDCEKTAFRTAFGSYEYTVLPMGLCNAPSTFMELMNNTFFDMLNKSVLCFLDDILIFSKTREEHLAHIREVLERLRKHKLYAKLRKCEFVRKEVSFLGHRLGENGLRVSQDKIDAVRDWPTPRNPGDIRSFLGLAGFYRKFVKHFSRIALPLTELTHDKAPWAWGAPQKESFEKLKTALCTAPVLLLPDPKLPYTLNTDACKFAMGATLQQDQGKGLQPVAFRSKKFSPAERNYDVREREFFGLVDACSHWRHYLHSEQPFKLLTDHDSLKYFKSQPNLGGRLTRWIDKMAEFDYTIEHIAGTKNVVADALSRRWDLEPDDAPATQPAASLANLEVADPPGPALAERIVAAAAADSAYQQRVADAPAGLTVAGGLLYEGMRLVVPNDAALRTALLAECHDSITAGHAGRDKTLQMMQSRFSWPGMSTDVAQYVVSCDSCQRNKPSQQLTPGLLMPLPIPERPFQSWSQDMVSGIPRTLRGYDAIQVYVDRLTKLKHFAACRTTDGAVELADLFLQNVIRLHGVPESIVSDRDPRFTANFYEELSKLIGVKLSMSTAAHPQTDGQSENAIKDLITKLTHFCNENQDDWDQHLAMLELAANQNEHASTKLAPFEVVFGQPARLPLDVKLDEITPRVPAAVDRAARMKQALDFIRANLVVAQERQKRNADRHRRELKLDVGDKVLLSTEHLKLRGGTNKLCSRYVGPFTVKKVVNANAFELVLPPQLQALHPVFNISRLKPYVSNAAAFATRPQRFDRPPPEAEADSNGNAMWQVDRVLACKKVGRGKRYLVAWKGYPPEENTWEPHAAISHTSAFEDFQAAQLAADSEVPAELLHSAEVLTKASAGAMQSALQGRAQQDVQTATSAHHGSLSPASSCPRPTSLQQPPAHRGSPQSVTSADLAVSNRQSAEALDKSRFHILDRTTARGTEVGPDRVLEGGKLTPTSHDHNGPGPVEDVVEERMEDQLLKQNTPHKPHDTSQPRLFSTIIRSLWHAAYLLEQAQLNCDSLGRAW